MSIPRIPYKIAALGQFKPNLDPDEFTRPIQVDLYTVDRAVAKVKPRIPVSVDRSKCSAGFLDVQFEALGDFKPDKIIRSQPYLKQLDEARRKIADGMASGRSAESIAGEVRSICPDLPIDLTFDRQASSTRKETDPLASILSMVSVPQKEPGGSGLSGQGPLKWQEDIDGLLRDLIGEIFRDPLFRACEASWRGVETLLKQGTVKEGGGVMLELVAVTDQTLETALKRLAPVFNDSRPDLVLIDLPLDNTLVKIKRLEKLADFAQNLLVPTLGWVAQQVFGIENWTQLTKLPYLPHHMDDIRFAKLRKVRQHDGGRWLALTCNRFMVRYPYGDELKPRSVSLHEEQPLWISPVWALAALVAQSVTACGWPTVFTRYGDIRLQDLPVGDFSGSGYCATEFLPSEERILQLIEAGFIPLVAAKNSDSAFMPRETTFTEGSLRFQLMLSRLLGFLFWCRENLEPETGAADPARQLEAALAQFWRRTGHEPPDDLKVSAVGKEDDGSPVLKVKMTPPDSVLRGGFKVEFSFVW